MWLGRQRLDRWGGLRQGVEQLPVVRGQSVDSADEVFDIGPQLGQLGGVLASELLQFDDLPTQTDLGSGVCPRALTCT
ncbi:hypothetical protein GCM10010446_32640 [Streptomyces enissocaesilis]|uniref:Uncharacterized protein n=1 Tax=Streptomyces enissocaesilis TaxID=332589 RepID=A0ABN3X9X7_9ACTN